MSAAAPSEIDDELAAVTVPSFAESRLQVRDLRDVARKWRFVFGDDALALAILHGHCRNFGVEITLLDGSDSAPHGLGCVLILLAAREAVLLRRRIREVTHHVAVERALQAVEEHVIDELRVAHAQSGARFGQQIRSVRHRLDAAREHDLRRAGADLVRGQHHGLQAGAAHLVHGCRRHLLRHAGRERCLASRRLADARHEHAAENGFVDLRGIDAAVFDRGLSSGGAQLRRSERAQHALECTDGSTTGSNDVDVFTHGA
jgi:hypothetical protein